MERVGDPRAFSAATLGNERAFANLLEPLVDAAYRLACAMLHDPQAAEDAVQEASITAWRRLDRVDDLQKLRPWFLSIVANQCRNARRLGWLSRVTIGLPPTSSVASDEERIVRGADLARSLARLRERERLVVLLFFYLDLPLEEVAVITHASVGATRFTSRSSRSFTPARCRTCTERIRCI